MSIGNQVKKNLYHHEVISATLFEATIAMTNQFAQALQELMNWYQACCIVIGLAQKEPCQSGPLGKMNNNKCKHSTKNRNKLNLKVKSTVNK